MANPKRRRWSYERPIIAGVERSAYRGGGHSELLEIFLLDCDQKTMERLPMDKLPVLMRCGHRHAPSSKRLRRCLRRMEDARAAHVNARAEIVPLARRRGR